MRKIIIVFSCLLMTISAMALTKSELERIATLDNGFHKLRDEWKKKAAEELSSLENIEASIKAKYEKNESDFKENKITSERYAFNRKIYNMRLESSMKARLALKCLQNETPEQARMLELFLLHSTLKIYPLEYREKILELANDEAYRKLEENEKAIYRKKAMRDVKAVFPTQEKYRRIQDLNKEIGNMGFEAILHSRLYTYNAPEILAEAYNEMLKELNSAKE